VVRSRNLFDDMVGPIGRRVVDDDPVALSLLAARPGVPPAAGPGAVRQPHPGANLAPGAFCPVDTLTAIGTLILALATVVLMGLA
jgi:hypothetical protein